MILMLARRMKADGSVEVLGVLGQAPGAIDPGDTALDDPVSWEAVSMSQ